MEICAQDWIGPVQILMQRRVGNLWKSRFIFSLAFFPIYLLHNYLFPEFGIAVFISGNSIWYKITCHNRTIIYDKWNNNKSISVLDVMCFTIYIISWKSKCLIIIKNSKFTIQIVLHHVTNKKIHDIIWYLRYICIGKCNRLNRQNNITRIIHENLLQ